MQLLTRREVAQKCKMPIEWVEKASALGKIPSPVYLDGMKRWRESEIDDWIQKGCPSVQSREVMPATASNGHETVLTLEAVERAHIEKALHSTDGNREKAARVLGIGERTLYRKIKQYGIE